MSNAAFILAAIILHWWVPFAHRTWPKSKSQFQTRRLDDTCNTPLSSARFFARLAGYLSLAAPLLVSLISQEPVPS